MKSKFYIPKWLLPILFIIFLSSLIVYFIISKSPRIEDLFINLSATVFGIILTLYLVERSIKINEKKEWKEFEDIITNQIIDILFTVCNYMNIHSSLWIKWWEILKYDIDKKNKISQYINLFSSTEIDSSYIEAIINEDHLINFFSDGYTNAFNQIDELFRLYSDKLSAKQSTLILNLKHNLFSLSNNMSTFSMFNIAIKELKAKIEIGHMNDFKENVSKTILTMQKLIDVL